MGNPLGLSGSVTSGIISATGRVVAEPASEGGAGATLPNMIQNWILPIRLFSILSVIFGHQK